MKWTENPVPFGTSNRSGLLDSQDRANPSIDESDPEHSGADCSTMFQYPMLGYQPADCRAVNSEQLGNLALRLAFIYHFQRQGLLLGRQ